MRLNKENGFTLIGTMFVAILILMVMVMAVLFNSKTNLREATTLTFSNKAFYLADSGISAAVAQLRASNTNLTAINYTIAADAGNYSVSLTPIGPNNIQAISRGRYRDSTKTIRANIVVQSPGEYFGASAKDLTIAYGTVAPAAKIYGRTLNFFTGSIADTHTQLEAASYFIGPPTDFDPDYIEIARDLNSDGDKTDPGETGLSPLPVTTEPILPILDSAKMDNYTTLADKTTDFGGGIVMDLDGDGLATLGDGVTIPAPANGNGIYYFKGAELNIQGSINGKFVIVVDGNIKITGDVLYPTAADLVALISTKDVIIDVSAPGPREINGLIIAPYGNLLANGDADPANILTFNGGFLVNNKVELASVFVGGRNYSYIAAQTTIPELPFLVYVDKWEEIQN